MENFPNNQGNGVDGNSGENNGVETLANMPAFEEHMKSFAEVKQTGEVAEGVRDRQDYDEYQQEKQARLAEAQNFIKNSYYDENLPVDENYNQEVAGFLNSKNLQIVAERGFDLAKMNQLGLIARFDGTSTGRARAFADTSEIVDDLASFCEVADKQDNGNDLISAMHGIFSAWKDNGISAPQYEMVCQFLPPMTNLSHRLKYGEIVSEEGRAVEEESILKHSIRYMREIPNMEVESVADRVMEAACFVDKKEGELNSKIVTIQLKAALGELSHAMLTRLIYDKIEEEEAWTFDIDDAKLTVKEAITCYDFEAIKAAKAAQLLDEDDDGWGMHIPAFSDEELLGAMYDLKDSDIENADKTYGQKEPAYKLARHFGMLERAGFSKKSLLRIIHNSDMTLHTEEIEDMRSAGVNNAEIAYAANAYKNCYIRDGKREWINEDLAEFSDTDLLDAAIMDGMNQQGWPIQ